MTAQGANGKLRAPITPKQRGSGLVPVNIGGLMFGLLREPVTRVKFIVLSRGQTSIMSTQSGATGDRNPDNRSIHSGNVEEVHNVPMQVIVRPIPPVLDELKVQNLMKTITVNSAKMLQ